MCGQYIMRHTYPRKQEGKNTGITFKDKLLTILLLITFVLFVGSLSQTYIKIKKIKKEVQSRQHELAELKQTEEELKQKYAEVTSPDYIEKQLRDRLNLSKENEIVLVLPPDEVLKKFVPPDEAKEKADLTPNWRKWMNIFGL